MKMIVFETANCIILLFLSVLSQVFLPHKITFSLLRTRLGTVNIFVGMNPGFLYHMLNSSMIFSGTLMSSGVNIKKYIFALKLSCFGTLGKRL